MSVPALPFDFAKINRIAISACGTAYYAGLIAKYWFERFARLPVEIDVASEFRYREAPFSEGGLSGRPPFCTRHSGKQRMKRYISTPPPFPHI